MAVHNKKNVGALLSDLSKAFDCLSHDLLNAKLNAYGFSIDSLRLVKDNWSNRRQRTRLNLAYISWEKKLLRVPQRSFLGPLLFNIFLYDLFFIMDGIDFASYADDNTPYTIGSNMEDVIFQIAKFVKNTFVLVYE